MGEHRQDRGGGIAGRRGQGAQGPGYPPPFPTARCAGQYGQRITINLAPADVRKEGPSFDLPLALGMLKPETNNRLPEFDTFCITGELALSSQLRPVKGVLSIALEAKRRHRQILSVPVETARKAGGGGGVNVLGV